MKPPQEPTANHLLAATPGAGLFNSRSFTMMTFLELRALAPTGIDAGSIASASASASAMPTPPGDELRCNFGSVAVKSHRRVGFTVRGAR